MVRVHKVAIEVHCFAVATTIICLQWGMAGLAEADEIVRVDLQPRVVVAFDDVVNLGCRLVRAYGFASCA